LLELEIHIGALDASAAGEKVDADLAKQVSIGVIEDLHRLCDSHHLLSPGFRQRDQAATPVRVVTFEFGEALFLQRADEFPRLYGTWARRTEAPFHGLPEVGEAHHAQADLTRMAGLTVPDKLADVDGLIAELLGRNLAPPKSLRE